jgi:hypothetical protein
VKTTGIWLTCVAAIITVSSAGTAHADGNAPNDTPTEIIPSKDVKNEIPIVAYAYSANGASARTIGVQAYGLSLSGSGQRTVVGGGGTVWGSPIDRLTLIGDAPRDMFGNFAPSAAVVVRLLGTPNDGFTLSALGKFKVEGFATGPNNEMESEIEGGLLLSYVKYGWHMDVNAISGFGTGDDGEIDSEGRLRIGHDIGSIVRLGIDGQARYRLAGDNKLPGNRNGDFAAGPQLLIGSSNFFGSLTSGPATMGVSNNIGFTTFLSVGGATL